MMLPHHLQRRRTVANPRALFARGVEPKDGRKSRRARRICYQLGYEACTASTNTVTGTQASCHHHDIASCSGCESSATEGVLQGGTERTGKCTRSGVLWYLSNGNGG
jgi:hypothetical protein